MSKPEDLPYQITLEVRDSCLCLHLRRAARAVARRFDAALRPLDLTNGQFSLLMSLNRPDPPPVPRPAESARGAHTLRRPPGAGVGARARRPAPTPPRDWVGQTLPP